MKRSSSWLPATFAGIFSVVLLLLLFAAALEELDIDGCLDAGGSWITADNQCEGAGIGYEQASGRTGVKLVIGTILLAVGAGGGYLVGLRRRQCGEE